MASVTVTEEQRTYFFEYMNGAALHQIAIRHGATLEAVIRACKLGGLEPTKPEIGRARLEIVAADGQALAKERRTTPQTKPTAAPPPPPAPAPAPKPAPPKPTPSPVPEAEPAVVDPKQLVVETYKVFGNVAKAAKVAGVSWPTAKRIIEAAGLKKAAADAIPAKGESNVPEPVEIEPADPRPTAADIHLDDEVLDQIFGGPQPRPDASLKEPEELPSPTPNSSAHAGTHKQVALPAPPPPSMQSGLQLIGDLDHLLEVLAGQVSHARLDVLLTALHSLADAHHPLTESKSGDRDV